MKKNTFFLPADNNYAPYVAVTIASLCDNSSFFCDIYILDGGITEKNKEKICELKKVYDNFSIEFINIDVDKEFKDFPLKNERFNYSVYMRLLIPQLKPELTKSVYLDSDVVVTGDIKTLCDISLEKFVLGAMLEEFNKLEKKHNLGDKETYSYFNAGVLMINNADWIKLGIFEEIRKISKLFYDKINLADQDILNICFQSNYKKISPEYNWINQNYEFYEKEFNIVIRHFNGVVKPWHIHPSVSEDKRLSFTRDFHKFWDYAKKTAFNEELLSKVKYKTNADLKKFLVLNLLKKK